MHDLQGPGVGGCALVHLPAGVTVWLCRAHRHPEFLARRAGRDLVASLSRVWAAAGCLEGRRSDALSAHLRRVRGAGRSERLPGSYAWPGLRAEAERRFAAGEPPSRVIADLRERHADNEALAPSRRTMQRWFAEGRWLSGPPARPPAPPTGPGGPGSAGSGPAGSAGAVTGRPQRAPSRGRGEGGHRGPAPPTAR